MYKYYEKHWMRYFMCCDLKKQIPELNNVKHIKY